MRTTVYDETKYDLGLCTEGKDYECGKISMIFETVICPQNNIPLKYGIIPDNMVKLYLRKYAK